MKAIITILLGTLLLSACTTVEPWERGILARDDMALDFDASMSGLQQQVYISKEAASGSAGLGGGGCGCN